MRGINLKALSLDELLDVRDYTNALLRERRQELQQKLGQLGEIGGAAARRRTRGPSKMKGRKVAPKYRDPESGATWAGRGARPRWLQALLKRGRKIEDFAIGKAGGRRKQMAKRGRRKKR